MRCKTCNKREAKQQVWKSPEQKKHCFTCWHFIQYVKAHILAFQNIADQKKIPKTIMVYFNRKYDDEG
jgi:hypothetical protein|tara:strand:- start:125 stop:328 length:204 start_codon:yes stop_codon:yes gene_type:complete